MLSPFHHLSKPFEKKLTIFLLVLFVFSLIGMNISGGEFTNEVAPFGIVSFELGKTLANSQAILNSWNTETQLFAAFNTAGLDSLFLIVYSLFFALLLHKLAFRFWKDKNKNLFSLGIILSYLMLFAALLDAVENYAMLRLLFGSLKESWSQIAFYCAVPKFLILLVSIIYLVLGWIIKMFAKIS